MQRVLHKRIYCLKIGIANLPSFVICAHLLTATSGTVNVQADTTTNTAPTTIETTSFLDRMHQGVSRFVVRSCDRLDHHLHKRFFAENPHESGHTNLLTNSTIDDLKSLPNHKGSLIRLSPAIEIEEGGKIDTDLRFDAKINLPRFKERVNLVFQSEDNDREVLEGITDQATRQRRIENEDDSLAGLRVRVLDETRFKIDLGAGAKFKPEPIPKLKARFKVSRTGAKWSFTLSEAVFWESDDGFGEKTEFAWSHRFNPDMLFRSSSQATWSETTRGVGLGQSFIFTQQLCPISNLAYKLGVTGHTEPEPDIDEWNLRLAYTRQVYREWLFFEIEPGIDFRHERGYQTIPLCSFRMHILFGDLSRGW